MGPCVRFKISRPLRFQELVYNGHKRFHGLSYQSIMAPDGLVISLFGPQQGAVHDSKMLFHSRLMADAFLPSLCRDGGYYIFGDQAYPLSKYLIKGHRGVNLSPTQSHFNEIMSGARIAVEQSIELV